MSTEESNDARNTDHSNDEFPYCCDIDVTFPTSRHAEQTMQVMRVDKELGDKVVKSFSLHGEGNRTLRISFQAGEAKLLRVVVSSFFDYLVVALKVYQEFDPTLHDSGVISASSAT
ncbi:hypothetical protein ACA910_015934 [Epithemia clementina (nom. ined.)]